jgi:UDP-N-acetylglucosamine acyltransferase
MTLSGTQIDASARVDARAEIGNDVSIGPFCVVGPDVVIGDGCRLIAHVHVTGHTRVGPRTVIYPFASLGTPPQSLRHKGEPTRLLVGSDCDIREGVTMNTGTEFGGGVTTVGDRCFFMVGSHVAHDCTVGTEVIFANNAVLGGHVTVGDFTVFGGQAAVRQFVRIGEGAMVVGLSGVRADVIPWGMVQGPLAELVGLNVVGMRRRGFGKDGIHRLRRAYQAAFFGAGTFRERLEAIAADHGAEPSVARMLEFIRSGTRPLTMASDRNGGAEGE